MQKTNFRFEAIVHDDASTDGTAAIIREYAEKYPDIIKPIYETENQYSKHDGSLRRIMDEACKGKYIALCEGDDYWTDPQKLQIQVDFMENHPDFSLCFHDFKSWRNGSLFDSNNNYPIISQEVYVQDCLQHGGWVFTASRLYRNKYRNQINNLCQGCCVGDYPQAIALSLCGRVFYMNKSMCVYRQGHMGSFMTKTKFFSQKQKILVARNISEMLYKANQVSKNKYNKDFNRAIFNQLYNAGDWESLGKFKFAEFMYHKPLSRIVKFYFCCLHLFWLWDFLAHLKKKCIHLV